MNLACSGLAPNSREADWVALAGDNHKLQRGMERLYRLFEKAAVLGSLINPRVMEGDLLEAGFHELQPLLEKALAGEGGVFCKHPFTRLRTMAAESALSLGITRLSESAAWTQQSESKSTIKTKADSRLGARRA